MTACIASINAVFEYTQVAFRTTVIVNAPLRLCGLCAAIEEGSCLRGIFNAASFAALFLPHSRLVSIGIDIALECVNCCYEEYINSEPELIASNQSLNNLNLACQILQLPLDESLTMFHVERGYQAVKGQLESQKRRFLIGSEAGKKIQEDIDQVEAAYRVLKAALTKDPQILNRVREHQP